MSKREAVASWEDFLDDEPEPLPPKAAPKPAPMPTKEKGTVQEPLTAEEKKKLVEDAEKRLLNDLFAGCERPENFVESSEVKAQSAAHKSVKTVVTAADVLRQFSLRSYMDCEKFAEAIGPKIYESPAKSPAWFRLLDLLLKECSPKMDVKDLTSLQVRINACVTEKKKLETVSLEKKKKPNAISACKNFIDEVEMMYGDLSDDDEDEDFDSFP